jgi:hypothetical protein
MGERWERFVIEVDLDVGTYGEAPSDTEVEYLLHMGGINAKATVVSTCCPDCGFARALCCCGPPEWIELTTTTNHLSAGVHPVHHWLHNDTTPVVVDAEGGWNHLPAAIWRLPEKGEPARCPECGSERRGAPSCGCGWHDGSPT